MIIKANMLNMLKVFHDEFKKLELAKNVEDGAQVNVIESISINGVNQPVTNKNVALNLDAYAKKSELNILNTTPSTVEGKVWFEFENHQPILKIFYGGEVFTLSGAVSYSQDGIYYFSRTGTNLIADLQPENMIILKDGLEVTDAHFVTRNEYKDLILTLGDGVTATIRTTTAAAFEHLDTQGRTLTFIDNDERRHPVTFYSDGRITEGAAITLGSDFADTAFDAGTFTTVKAVRSPISIQGGTVASALIGGGGNDTLTGNSGNDTLTGGAGNDLFAVKLTGDNVITDFDAACDQISLVASGMDNVRGMNAASDGLTLEFNGGSLMLGGFSSGTVTVNGTPYIVEDSAIYNAERTSATFFKPVTANLADDLYLGILTVNAAGGAGADTYLFNGGDITISNYASGDKVSLAAGYLLKDYNIDLATSQSRLTIVDTQDNVAGFITFSGLDENTKVELRYTPDGATEPEVITEKFGQAFIFNNNSHRAAIAVTVKSAVGDFGVIGSPTGTATNGSEYYASIKKIVATKPNSTLCGNKNANTFYFVGGEDNIATGGLNADTFIFNSCGGTIRDFGVIALRDLTKTYAKATTTKDSETYYAYNRDISGGVFYSEGKDTLKVDGTVTAIAFSGHGDSSTKVNRSFDVWLLAVDPEGNSHSIGLKNINKPLNGKVYVTDDNAVQELIIYDYRTGESAPISTDTLTSLVIANTNTNNNTTANAVNSLVNSLWNTSLNEERYNGMLSGLIAGNG